MKNKSIFLICLNCCVLGCLNMKKTAIFIFTAIVLGGAIGFYISADSSGPVVGAVKNSTSDVVVTTKDINKSIH